MYRLYGKPYTMSMLPEGTLDEIGAEYDLIELPDGRSTDPAYLALRPDGLVPTLVDDDVVLFEGSAIAMYLCDRHPSAELAPPPGTPDRARWYQWMLYLNSVIHPAVANEYHADWFTTDEEGVEGVRQAARDSADLLWSQIDNAIVGMSWLTGQAFTTADILFVVEAYMHWNYPAMFEREQNVRELVLRIQSRPKMCALLERHGVETIAGSGA